MDDNCVIIGFVYPVQDFVGFVNGYDPIIGLVNQNPLTVIIGLTNC